MSDTTQTTIAPRLIPIGEVKRLTSLSKSTILRYIEAGHFPVPLRLGVNCVRWVESEVQGWIEIYISARNEAEKQKRADKSQ